MAGSLVERATSDLLIGPDWAMNVEICDILNHDPGQAKDAVKVLKRRLGNKSPKIQLLALTLLETMIKNCGDIIHMHIAEKGVPQKMVKIAKKKQPDSHVKEKILILLDTWQEAFGLEARYPQYYAAYQELLRAGAAFPRRPERSAPVFSPPQTRPLTSYPQSLRGPDDGQEAPESSGSDLPALSLIEIQNARGIMDVLAEMLNALDPGNREGLRQEVIVDLVGQCRSNKQRLVHLVNTTSDEELLCQGLALNDDLQRVLAKHDAIAAGITVNMETGIMVNVEKRKSLQALVDIDDPTIPNGEGDKEVDYRSTASSSTANQLPLQQLLLPAPQASNGTSTCSAKIDPHIDLLSGENFSTPGMDNPLALVPVNEPSPNTASEQNILVLSDMFPQSNNNNNNNISASSFDSQLMFQAPQTYAASPQLQVETQSPQPSLYANGCVSDSGTTQYEQAGNGQGAQLCLANFPWNGQGAQGFNLQQQAFDSDVNDHGGALPPPPWEVQSMQSNQLVGSQQPLTQNGQLGRMHTQLMQNGQSGGIHPGLMQSGELGGMNSQPVQNGQSCGIHPGVMQSGHIGGMHPQQIQSSQSGGIQPGLMQSGQLGGMHPHQVQSSQSGGIHPGLMQSSQQFGMYPTPAQNNHLRGAYAEPFQGGQMGGYYAYSQQPQAQMYNQTPTYPYANPNEVVQRMYGLTMQDSSGYMNVRPSYQTPSSSSPYLQQPMKPSKPEDKLFGDLVSLAKTKPNTPNGNKLGSL